MRQKEPLTRIIPIKRIKIREYRYINELGGKFFRNRLRIKYEISPMGWGWDGVGTIAGLAAVGGLGGQRASTRTRACAGASGTGGSDRER